MNAKYFAELLGAFSGDGWMSKNNGKVSLFITGNPKDEQDYYNQRIKLLFKKMFDFEVKPRHYPYWKTYGIYVGQKEIIDKMILYGMIVGRKSLDVSVPNIILANSDLHLSFIRGLFDTDGCIYFKKSYNKNASKWQKEKRHRPSLLFSTISPKLAKQVKHMLKQNGFNFFLRKYKPRNGNYPDYELRLEGKENTKRFFRLIKPQNTRHINKFNTWLTEGFY